MSLERFEALAGAYGGSLARWPADVRDAAERLAAMDPAAAALLDSAARLDAALALAPAASPGAALVGRIILDASRRTSRRLWRWLAGAGVGAALAGACAAGVAAGALLAPAAWTQGSTTATADPAEEASALLGESPELAGAVGR
ncbi:MAG TPA: hypothetical protein VFE03_11290 [Caulobacteraceae bacterium]|nr:hypothetical protein [Caulobacteraceae bacterium]